MNIFKDGESRHGTARLAAVLLPLAVMIGCNSAPTGHAPGVAGGQSLSPGISNYPLAYIKQPVLAANTDKTNKAATPTDIDTRDLITSITGSDLYVRDTASAGTEEVNVVVVAVLLLTVIPVWLAARLTGAGAVSRGAPGPAIPAA